MVDRRGPALSTSASATPISRSIALSLRQAPATNSSDCRVIRPARISTPIRTLLMTRARRFTGPP
ncbi:Uncharacterised protein [Mycobacteroides abscessus subsp. abscessus]|nr:Uncharacterised protein [Mycobacteroides abscessus subsp. abscessus]